MKKRMSLGTQAFIIVSLMLLAVNITLGILMINQSRNSLKTLMRDRMLDISNTAAATVDGDALEKLTADDKDSEAYQSVIDSLTVFQNNIDLKYIYCVTKTDDGKFVFSVDPTVVDPGEFGSPVVYTDALNKASEGTPSVDDTSYTDSWGTFYSAYSPVFNSKGEVAGVVAVDFDAQWYDTQIRNIVITITVCCVGSLLIGALIILIITSKLRRKFVLLNNELVHLATEVDNLTKEIIPESKEEVFEPSDKEGEISYSETDITHLGERLRATRRELLWYINHSNTREKSMVAALSVDYRSVYFVDLDEDKGVCYRSHSHLKGSVPEGAPIVFSVLFGNYALSYVADEYREEFLRFISSESIREGLESNPVISLRYLAVHNGVEEYEMIKIASIRLPEDEDDNIVHNIGIAFSNVDKETREEMNRSRTLSEALAAAEESNKAKTSFLSNMSHEIRTPMNAIIGLDNIALSNPDISERTRNELEKIGISAKHLLNIINDILDMSRIESGRMILNKEEFSISAVLEQVNTIISGQCREKGLEYTCRTDPKIGEHYIGDDARLRQVLINILGNSVKFTPEGGKVEFSVEAAANYEGKTTLRFVMKDNGIGMDKDFVPYIFDAFSQENSSATTRYGSTGLGMAITKSYIDMMNGKIEVESEKGVGTTFTVTLTLNAAAVSSLMINTDGQQQELKVLVVDPDKAGRKQTRFALEKIGIKSDTVPSGEKAVKTVSLMLARREPYNLIIVDRDLRDMDGLEAVRQICSAAGSSAAVILTAHEEDNTVDDAKAAGAESVIFKPVSPKILLDEIKRLVTRKSETASGEKHKAELNGKRALLAEDAEINAEIIKVLLGERGMTVELAENGRIAVDMFTAQPAGYYSAILMDMRMPEMDGLTATSVIRTSEHPDAASIPIIALTANAFDEDVQRSLQMGLNAHLSKPVDPEKLFSTLESLISD